MHAILYHAAEEGDLLNTDCHWTQLQHCQDKQSHNFHIVKSSILGIRATTVIDGDIGHPFSLSDRVLCWKYRKWTQWIAFTSEQYKTDQPLTISLQVRQNYQLLLKLDTKFPHIQEIDLVRTADILSITYSVEVSFYSFIHWFSQCSFLERVLSVTDYPRFAKKESLSEPTSSVNWVTYKYTVYLVC